MYPLLPSLVRICNENYQLDEHTIIDKNTRVIIPVKGLHYDPLYYENPFEFDPEHFSKEAKAKRHHFTYLPFGEGPRICIGKFVIYFINTTKPSALRTLPVSRIY